MLRDRRRSTLLAVLVWTMTATTFQIFALAVLAAEIIGDLGLSRAELGLIGSVNTMVGALSAPYSGRLTDRIGPWNASVAAMMLGAAGMAAMAVAPNAVMLSLSALICGIPQGWGNPATNALIAERVAPGARGTVTGVKQSGVQFGVFLSGFTLPSLALVFGWRGAIWFYAGAFAIGALATAIGFPRHPAAGDKKPLDALDTQADPHSHFESEPRTDGVMDPWIWRLAFFALLLGTLGGAIGRFFPLWAEEAIGLSTTRAGLIVALTGALGIVARIAAGRVAERLIEPSRLLRILAAVGGIYGVVLLAAPLVGAWLLWPGTILNAIGIGAWNAVAMLAIIMVVPKGLAGRASGIVMLGFLGGLSVGSPIAGSVVDRWGSYQPVWACCILLSALAVLSLSATPQTAAPAESVTPRY